MEDRDNIGGVDRDIFKDTDSTCIPESIPSVLPFSTVCNMVGRV